MPVFLGLLEQFNDLAGRVNGLIPDGSELPQLELLPLDLTTLRDYDAVWQDLWLNPIDIPDWVKDKTVRSAIRSLLISDRCKEERERIAMECSHMREWFQREAFALY